jgi:hypothetical protein
MFRGLRQKSQDRERSHESRQLAEIDQETA